jgi:hypothetical protein
MLHRKLCTCGIRGGPRYGPHTHYVIRSPTIATEGEPTVDDLFQPLELHSDVLVDHVHVFPNPFPILWRFRSQQV